MAAIPVMIDVTVNNVKEVSYKDDKGRDAISYRLMCNFDEFTFAEIRCTEEVAKTVVKKHRYILGGSAEPNPVRNNDPRPLRIDRILEDRGYSFAGLDEDYLRAMQQFLSASRPDVKQEESASGNENPEDSADSSSGSSRKSGKR